MILESVGFIVSLPIGRTAELKERKIAQAVTFSIRIRLISGSDLDRDFEYPEFFMIFRSLSRRMPGQCLELGQYRFLQHPFQFNVH
jgi:hypothetical protein